MSSELRITEEEIKGLATKIYKACPRLARAISAKRYLLPNYRQPDYYNQEFLDGLLAVYFSGYYNGRFGPNPDAIIRAMYRLGVMGIQEARPIYFLERELGEALLRTQLPLDLSTDDIKWRRRQLRIMLPRELIAIERDGEQRSAMYLDIGKAEADEKLILPLDLVEELRLYGLFTGQLQDPAADVPVPIFDRSGMVLTTQLSSDSRGVPGENYGTMRPFEGLKLRDIKVGGHFDTGSLMDESDDAFLARLEHLALNCLLFMGSVPMEYEPSASDMIRKLQVFKDRIVPSLLKAKFVGASQYRPAYRPAHVAHFTGRKLAQHWKCGHWKRQPSGPRWSERTLIWVEPYQTSESAQSAKAPESRSATQ
jgi:hypothetical protein